MSSLQDMALDCIQRLNASGIAYMVSGSTASNRWGIPRTTHDVDIVVQFAPSQVPAMMTAFAGRYFIQEISVRSVFRPPHQFNAIDEASGFKVDFWLLRNGPFEIAAFNRRTREDFLGEPAWVATAEDVLLHKLHWNRLSPSERQIGDAAGIFAVQDDQLDLNYLRHWAEKTLEQILNGTIRPKTT
jgi:hypothetical protein